ncbi:MAG: hypothetical protein ACON32_13490, partial [Pirellulaceae bacterium]
IANAALSQLSYIPRCGENRGAYRVHARVTKHRLDSKANLRKRTGKRQGIVHATENNPFLLGSPHRYGIQSAALFGSWARYLRVD